MCIPLGVCSGPSSKPILKKKHVILMLQIIEQQNISVLTGW